jgi:hypothetical protein
MSSKPNSAQSDPVGAAAAWLAQGGADRSKPLIPQIRHRFSLSAREAVQALREATLQRARSS